jgi:type IV pilus assembly protein PilO
MTNAILEVIKQKKLTLAVALVLLLLNIGLYVATAGYLEPRIAESHTAWSALRQRMAVAGKTDVAAIYRHGVDDMKKLEARIPVKRQFVRVLGDILDAAASNAVVTGNISYKPQAVKDHDLLAYSISMSAGGSYAAVKSYLADLQRNSELIVIESVSFSKNDLYEENVVMDLKLTVYLQGKEGA